MEYFEFVAMSVKLHIPTKRQERKKLDGDDIVRCFEKEIIETAPNKTAV